MAHISRFRIISAAPEAVWSVLTDFGSIGSWASRIDHSCLLQAAAEPVGRTRRVQVGRIVLVERIVEFDPPGALAYAIEGLPSSAGRVRNRWDLHPLADAATEVTLTTTVDIGARLPQRLFEKVVCRVSAKLSDDLLTGLATHLEATHV